MILFIVRCNFGKKSALLFPNKLLSRTNTLIVRNDTFAQSYMRKTALSLKEINFTVEAVKYILKLIIFMWIHKQVLWELHKIQEIKLFNALLEKFICFCICWVFTHQTCLRLYKMFSSNHNVMHFISLYCFKMLPLKCIKVAAQNNFKPDHPAIHNKSSRKVNNFQVRTVTPSTVKFTNQIWMWDQLCH